MEIDFKLLNEELSIKEIIYLCQYYDNPDGRVWGKVSNNISAHQLDQVLNFISERELKKQKEWLASATQDEKDGLFRSSAIFNARDHWFATIFDIYEVVNNTGDFANWGIDKIRNSSPINYAIEEIDMRLSYMKEGETFSCFSGSTHPFSMCFPTDIMAHDTILKSALHYLVYEKASLFLDRENMDYLVSDKILLQDLPLLNKQIKYYNKIVWKMEVGGTLKKVIKAKFTQNEDLKTALFNTKGKTIVLADVNDNKWGVGLTEDDPRILKRATWQGKNLLGELLTTIRIEIMGEY